MTRDLAIIALLAFLLIVAGIMFREHRPQMTVVQADYPQGDAHQLFTPCPIEPRNFPQWKERKA